MSEPITVWQLLSDGSHIHQDGKRCRLNHKRSDYRKWVALAGLFGFFTLAIHLILKANGL